MISLPVGMVLFAIIGGVLICRELFDMTYDLHDQCRITYVFPMVLMVGCALATIYLTGKVFLHFFTPNF